MFCNHCGSEVTENSQYCMHCGKILEFTQKSDASSNMDRMNDGVNSKNTINGPVITKKKKSKIVVFIFASIVILATLSILVVFFVNSEIRKNTKYEEVTLSQYINVLNQYHFDDGSIDPINDYEKNTKITYDTHLNSEEGFFISSYYEGTSIDFAEAAYNEIISQIKNFDSGISDEKLTEYTDGYGNWTKKTLIYESSIGKSCIIVIRVNNTVIVLQDPIYKNSDELNKILTDFGYEFAC